MKSTGTNFLITDEMLCSGVLSCRGCGWSLLARHVSSVLGKETIYVVPASCFSIITGPYPLNAVKGTIVHTLFAASAATATGIRAALDIQGNQISQVVVLAGDGGTFDIGIQALSGAAARGENIIYICNNNGAYMNTGIQTSTATPPGALTTTNPEGRIKTSFAKDLMGIVAAHHVPYFATASLAFLSDFREKIKKAKETPGFRFIMVDGPCPPGHKYSPELSIEIARLAVETKMFPLFEAESGKYKINYIPKKQVPAGECMKMQGRFTNLFKNGSSKLLQEIQKKVDEEWECLLRKAKEH